MDFLIFYFASIQFLLKKYHIVFVSIFILASSYLEVNYGDGGKSNFIFPHQVSDTGLLLFIFFFLYSIIKHGLYTNSKLRVPVLVFWIFLLLSGFVDVLQGVAIVDVIKYLRGWLYLLIIYIDPELYVPYIEKTLRYLFVIVLILTILIIFQNVTDFSWFGTRIDEVRGIKPSFYVLLFIPLLLFDVLRLASICKYLFIAILVSSIILNLKQTYLFTVIFTYVLFLILYQKQKLLIFLKVIVILTAILALILTNNSLRERISETIAGVGSIKNEKSADNFSFRILHTKKRLNYILENPLTTLRGIGFIHEDSLRTKIFAIGSWNQVQKRIEQLETGDIAWSVFFVRIGVFGTILFLFFYLSLLKRLYLMANSLPPSENQLHKVLFSFMIVCLFLTSFGNSVIAYGYFYLIPLMTVASKNKSNLNIIEQN